MFLCLVVHLHFHRFWTTDVILWLPCLSLCCGVGSLVRTPVVSIRFVSTAACQAESARSEGQLSRHDCDMEQPGLCGRCQARCSREGKLHVSLLLAVAVQAASGADGYADGRVEGLRWRPGCRPGRDAI